MNCYRGLAWLFPRSYRAKLMLVVLIGTTLPVALFAIWLAWNNGIAPQRLWQAAMLTAALVLAGTLGALLVLYHLLAPLRAAAEALEAYDARQAVPQLPEWGDDEMGRLLRGVNRSLRRVDAGVRRLERDALEDALTGGMNRRGCEQALAASIARSSRERLAFVLFVVDVDNLKPINDEFGHAAGDRALRALVASAARVLREDDWIGRWGGDEFLLGVHDTVDSARRRVGDWLEALATPQGDALPVQVSAGCADFHDQDAMALYRQADAAMYEAKFSGGRQLVCHATPDATRTIVSRGREDHRSPQGTCQAT